MRLGIDVAAWAWPGREVLDINKGAYPPPEACGLAASDDCINFRGCQLNNRNAASQSLVIHDARRHVADPWSRLDAGERDRLGALPTFTLKKLRMCQHCQRVEKGPARFIVQPIEHAVADFVKASLPRSCLCVQP